jgi:hypothetical protein
MRLDEHSRINAGFTRSLQPERQYMTINAGVWIDHRKAVILLINEQGEDLRQITSDDNNTALSASGVQVKNSYSRKDSEAGGKLQPTVESQLDKYYDQVIASLKNADSIWILGPGKAKRELKKRIQGQKLKGHIARVETVDEMTDHEIAEHVRQLLCAGTQ